MSTACPDRLLCSGIRLQALGGDPGWIDDPAAAFAWQDAALSTGLFSGSTEAEVDTALGQVDAAESGAASYVAMAVVDYAGYDAVR